MPAMLLVSHALRQMKCKERMSRGSEHLNYKGVSGKVLCSAKLRLGADDHCLL